MTFFSRSLRMALPVPSLLTVLAPLATLALVAMPATVYAQTIAPTDRGWYDSTGSHTVSNNNVIVGLYQGTGYRNFFVFNIPTLNVGQVYTSAVLQLQMTPFNTLFSQAGYYNSVDATENYVLNDVTTSLTSLSAGTGGIAAYNDLGGGTTYGSRTFSSADNNTLVSMTLNAAALSALNAAAGSAFGLGGYVSTLSGTSDQTIFFSSDNSTVNGSNLVLTKGAAAAPEPGALSLLMLVLPLSGAIALRRRGRSG